MSSPKSTSVDQTSETFLLAFLDLPEVARLKGDTPDEDGIENFRLLHMIAIQEFFVAPEAREMRAFPSIASQISSSATEESRCDCFSAFLTSRSQ